MVKKFDDMFSCFDTILACDRQMDGRTDGRIVLTGGGMCLHQTAPVFLTVMSDPVSASAIAEVISDPQQAAIWRYLDHERRLADKEVFPSLVRHCGTRCRSLFVTHL